MNIQKAINSLKQKGYSVSYFENSKDATVYLNHEINKKIVGFGDSDTLLRLKLFESLSLHNEVYDPQHDVYQWGFLEIAKKSMTANVFLTSINAFSETGELVNIDGTGNRIAGSIFGHEKVFFVVGVNKLVPTLEEAVWRARNVSAPRNAMRLGLKTPCAKEGTKCFNCSSADRICNGMMVYLSKMDDIEMEIVIINETLGF